MPHVSLRRKILYALAFLVFVVSAIFITFFAFGYRFNTQSRIFIYSGTITIKPLTPKKVEFYLNGEPVKDQLFDLINNAYNINGIKPGEYLLEIKAPGYHSWYKQISVHSGLATEFWNVALTPDDPQPTRLDIVDPVFYKVSEGAKKIVYANRSNGPLNVFVYSTKDGTALKIFEEPSNRKKALSLEAVEFSPDQASLILDFKEADQHYYYLALLNELEKEGIQTNNLIYLNQKLARPLLQSPLLQTEDDQAPDFNVLREKAVSFPAQLRGQNGSSDDPLTLDSEETRPQGDTISQLRWMDNDNLYYLFQNNLYLLSAGADTIQPILDNLHGYTISQNQLYFVKAPQNLIFRSNRSGADLTQITENLIDQEDPDQAAYKIIGYDDKRIALINQDGELYLYNDNEKEYQIFKKISDRANGAQFSDDGKKLLYFNEDEIKVYYLQEWKVQPKYDVGSNITVYSNPEEKIQNAMWFKNYQNVLFSTPSEISLVELDTRDHINQLPLIQTGLSHPQPSYDQGETLLYFLNYSDQYVQLFELKFPEK